MILKPTDISIQQYVDHNGDHVLILTLSNVETAEVSTIFIINGVPTYYRADEDSSYIHAQTVLDVSMSYDDLERLVLLQHDALRAVREDNVQINHIQINVS